MVRPDAAQWVVVVSATARSAARPAASGAAMRTDTVLPTASAICEASVRFQMRS